MNNALLAADSRQSKLSSAARERMLGLRGEPFLFSHWKRAVFIHFEVDAEVLQREVPFKLDLYEGKAYVSFVAFHLEKMRMRLGGKLTEWLMKPVATHEFLNIRTYVRHRGETGIYFLAEYLPNRLSLLTGPRLYGLPYRLGKLEYQHEPERGSIAGHVSDGKNSLSYCAVGARLDTRTNHLLPRPARHEWGEGWGEGPPSKTREISPHPGPLPSFRRSGEGENRGRVLGCAHAEAKSDLHFGEVESGTLEEFLLERYAAFTERKGVKRVFRIWHPPWPQTPIEIELNDVGLLSASGDWQTHARFIGGHFSLGFENVWMGFPRKINP